jgi:hypothetical protein
MKNILLYGVALLAASAAQAQTTPTAIQTITFNTPQTLSPGSCPINGITTLTINSDGTMFTNGTPTCTTACTTNCGTTVPNVVVTPTLTGSPYTNGSGAAAPVISWTASQAANCTLPNATSNGFTYVAGANSFVLSTPPTVTSPTTYNFTVSCTSPSAAYTVSVVPASVSLTVNPNGSGTTTGCSPTQLSSTLGSTQLKRQCTGTASYSGNKFGQKAYNGNMVHLTDVLGGTGWPNYITGYSFTPTISAGYYIALDFVPTSSGSIQFTTDPSYGNGGLISLSTVPGKFLPTDAGVICAYGRGASNSLYINTTPGGYCSVAAGQTYYVNFASADYAGNSLCFPSNVSNSCASSPVSYSEIVGK